MSTVSIIIPCYNGALYLHETITSAMSQSVPPLEIIVVDDGSTDDSAAIATSFGPPVRVIIQPNQGESVARNRGAAESQGEYLLFLDADDLLAPTALEKLSILARDSQADFVWSGYARFTESIGDPQSIHMPPASLLPRVLYGSLGPLCAGLLRRSVFDNAGGFDGSIRYGEDWDFFARLAFNGIKVHALPTVLSYYRRHPLGQSQNRNARLERHKQMSQIAGRICAQTLRNADLCAHFADGVLRAALHQAEAARRVALSSGDRSELLERIDGVARYAWRLGNRSRLVLTICWLGAQRALAVKRWVDRITYGNVPFNERLKSPRARAAISEPDTTTDPVLE